MLKFALFTLAALLAATLLTGGVDAQETPTDDPREETEHEHDDGGGGALAITHNDNVIISATSGFSSILRLRDPQTTDDWLVSAGINGDFDIRNSGQFLFGLGDGPNDKSYLHGRDDLYLTALGGGSGDGDVFIDASGVGDIWLRAEGEETIVQSLGNPGPVAGVFRLQSNVAPQQVFQNIVTGTEWFFAMTGDDQFKISRSGTGKVEAKFFDTGNLTLAGALTQNSDVNNKTDLETADNTAILDALDELDMYTWEYLDQPGVTHLGPTAQDFAAAFGLGHTTTGITSVDADGVALAAIKAQQQLIEEQASIIADLTARIEALESGS